MKISVVVPVHNVPRNLLTPCLGSLAMQTLRKSEYEIIIVDDCSTEHDTLMEIEEFAEREPNASIVRHADNRGLNQARWSGVKNTSGEYVIFIDGDDPIVRDGLENLRLEAARVSADMVTAPMLRWHPLTKSYSDIPTTSDSLPDDYTDRLRVILSGNSSFSMCGRLFRREMLSEDVFELPIGLIHEDVTTFLRLAFKAKSVAHCAKPFYFYTLNFASITTRFSEKHPEGIIFGLRDWIRNAEARGLLDELSEAISKGAEKLVNVCVLERCLFSENLTAPEKARVLRKFREDYFELRLRQIGTTAPAVRFLNEADREVFEGDPATLSNELAARFPYAAPSQLKPDQALKYGIGPSEMAQRLKDKVVFVGQVDYQVRTAAAFARELTLQGHTCVVLDNSGFVAGGKRPFPESEHDIFYETEHVSVESGPYPVDWLSTARLVIVFNDFNDDFRDALEFRNRLDLPSVCAVEGINDFLRVDFEGHHILPYRRCEYVFLAGEHDQAYFADRKTYVTGMPVVEELSKKEVSFPRDPLAVLNVNFTYGVLEHERELYVQKASGAFAAVGLNWQITQHPMDKGKLDGCPISDKTQYELIDEGTVFVSRFATGILEALASGKPAIYFNPHQERVDKFKEPFGAFEIATTQEELAQALRNVLQDVERGVDFRERAHKFLKLHTGFDPAGPRVGAQFASAAIDIIGSRPDAEHEVSQLFYRAAKKHYLYNDIEDRDGVVFGEFDHRNKAQLSEMELVSRYFGNRAKLMIKMGGEPKHGLEKKLGGGWEVYEASEEAVTELSKSKGFKRADLLKMGIEASSDFALNDFPWNLDKPAVVLAEFADPKKAPLSHTADDLANSLIEQGYSVYVSEWTPSVGQEKPSYWRRMLRYSPNLELSDAHGKVIGFSDAPGEGALARIVKQTLKFDAKAEAFGIIGPSGPKQWSGEVVNTLLLELDRLWVLSLLQGHRSLRYRFSLLKPATAIAAMSLRDLARLAKEQRIPVTPPDSFDDEAYLKSNVDVAASVKDGSLRSGYEHYTLFGHVENRQRPSKA